MDAFKDLIKNAADLPAELKDVIAAWNATNSEDMTAFASVQNDLAAPALL